MLFSELVMKICLALALLAGSAVAGSAYQLTQNYEGVNFFDGFDFFTGRDPTNGFVQYMNRTEAESNGLILSGNNKPAYLTVNSQDVFSSNSLGRWSVRIESKTSFTHGLIISDIGHMPGGQCGTWPDWTLGPNWPLGGEIDIIEGVNSQTNNLMALHTSPNCTVSGHNQLGVLQSNNCDTTVNFNAGCGSTSVRSSTYGAGFNGVGGGVFATQWTPQYIRIWQFQAGTVPQDIIDGNPDPSTWGLPQANFEGDCVIDDHFADHKIIFDTTFCGDWAGNTFASDPICGSLAGGSCIDYVGNNPKDFINAYWSINSVKVYQRDEIVVVSSTTSTITSTSTIPIISTSTIPTTRVTTPISNSTAIFSSTTSVPILSTQSDVIPQSSVLGPGMGGSTSISYSSAKPKPSNTMSVPSVVPTNPAQIQTFKFLGCASSTSAFAGFTEVEVSPLMTLERCTASCGSYVFAGVFNTMCFCANTLDSATNLVDNGRCDLPCPGNATEACGGSAQPQRKRQASNQILLSVYANEALQPPRITATPTASTQIPQWSVLGYGLGGGVDVAKIVNIVLSAVYVDVCTGCPGGLETLTTCVTIADCGCRHGSPATATIPMTTLEKVCDSCISGGAGTVTVTVPVVQTLAAVTTDSIWPVVQTLKALTTDSILPVVTTAFPTRTSNATASIAVFTGAAQRVVGAEQAVAALVGVVALAMF